MPVWGWLIIVAVIAIAVLIIGYVWGRKTSPAAVDRGALAASEREAMQKRIEAEINARKLAEQARDALARDLKANLAWYNKHKEAIEDAAKEEFSTLVSDPSALDRKLDSLLGAADK